MASTTPRLEIKEVQTEVLGSSARIRLVVHNTGYLPTNVSQHAKQKSLVRGLYAEISCDGDQSDPKGNPAPEWIISGKLREQAGQLTGRSGVPSSAFGWNLDSTSDLHVFEWVVKTGATYKLMAKHLRAGTVETTVKIE